MHISHNKFKFVQFYAEFNGNLKAVDIQLNYNIALQSDFKLQITTRKTIIILIDFSRCILFAKENVRMF